MKLLHLEGVRGLSSLFVFFIHFLPRFWGSLLDSFGKNNQNPFVAIFFVLSGRVLTASALRANAVPSLSIIKRPFRLAVPLVVFVLFDSLVRFLWDGRTFKLTQLLLYPFYMVVSNGVVIHEPIPGAAWTLAREMEGSVLVYLLTTALSPFFKFRFRLIILASTLFYTTLTHSWLNHFVVGMLLAELEHFQYLKQFREYRFAWIVKTVIGFIAIVFFIDSPYTQGGWVISYLKSYQYNDDHFGVKTIFWQENIGVLLFSTSFLFLVETTDSLSKFFGWPIFVWIGRISFMLYLCHTLFIDIFADWLKKVMVLDSTIMKLIYMIICTVLLWLVSELLTIWIDEPSMWFCKWIITILLKDETWTMQSAIDHIPSLLTMLRRFIMDRIYTTKLNFILLFTSNHYPGQERRAS